MYNHLSKHIRHLWVRYGIQPVGLRRRYLILFWLFWISLWGGLCVFHAWRYHCLSMTLAAQKKQSSQQIALKKQQLQQVKQWQKNTWWWYRLQHPLSLLDYGAAWRRWAIKTHTQLLSWRRTHHHCRDRWCHDKDTVTLVGTWPAIEKALYAGRVLPGFLLSTRFYVQPIKSQQLQLNWQFDVFYPKA